MSGPVVIGTGLVTPGLRGYAGLSGNWLSLLKALVKVEWVIKAAVTMGQYLTRDIKTAHNCKQL